MNDKPEKQLNKEMEMDLHEARLELLEDKEVFKLYIERKQREYALSVIGEDETTDCVGMINHIQHGVPCKLLPMIEARNQLRAEQRGRIDNE